MTYDEKIAQVVEMAFKADLDEDAKVIVNEAIRVATEANAEAKLLQLKGERQ